jgi:hypothetical protein
LAYPKQSIAEQEDIDYSRTLTEFIQREYTYYKMYKDHTPNARSFEDVPKNYPQPIDGKWEGLGDCFFELPGENTQLTKVYISSIGGTVCYAQRCECSMR